MLAAIVVLPPFMAVYLLGAPLPLSRRVADLLLGIVPLVAISLLWCVTYDLTPAQSRPYAGSTKTNSMLELVIGQNGIRRFVRTQRSRKPDGAPPCLTSRWTLSRDRTRWAMLRAQEWRLAPAQPPRRLPYMAATAHRIGYPWGRCGW